MPTALREGPYRFYFVSFDCNEPPHVHVSGEGNEAQFWLEPVSLKSNSGFAQHEQNEIEEIILENYSQILKKWYEHCSGHG